MSDTNLNTVQLWLKAVITHPGHLSQRFQLADHQYGLNAYSLIKGDDRVPVETRVGIYTNGYLLRLLECMQADLPSLYKLLGADLFELFARGYLMEHPPHSFSLFELSAQFADYLDSTHPPLDGQNDSRIVEFKLPGELVRLERARLAVLLNKGTEGTQRPIPVGFFDFFSGNNTRFVAHPSLELLVQKMPLIQLYRQLMMDGDYDLPTLKTSYVAVTRIDFKIQFHTLTEMQFHFLHHLKTQAKATDIYAIIHAIKAAMTTENNNMLSEISLWLPNALQLGFILED